MSTFYNAYKREIEAGRAADQIHIDPVYMRLLCKLTDAYNAKTDDHYNAGELDFIPKDATPADMLELSIISYAMKYYPNTLEKTEKE